VRKVTVWAIGIVAAALTTTTAEAAWTPVRVACIKSVGYEPADWDAYRVPAGPAGKYRACRDKAEKKTSSTATPKSTQGMNDRCHSRAAQMSGRSC